MQASAYWRETVGRSGRVIAGLVLVVGAAACTSTGGDADGWIDVGTEDAIQAEAVIYLRNVGVFVVATDAGIIALSDDAQHLEGERVLYCVVAQGFIAPTHGERFDREGRYLSGPAMSDMDRVEVRVQAGTVSIHPGRVTEMAERSTGVTPPSSLWCDGPEDPPGFFRDH